MIIPHWLTLISLITLTGGCTLIWQLRHMAQNTPAIQTLLQTSANHQRLFLIIAFVPLALNIWALPMPQPLSFIDLRLVGLVLLMALAAALWLQRIGWAIGVMTLLLLLQSALSRSATLADWLLPTLTDWLHLTLAAIWLGGVALLGLVIMPAILRDPAYIPALASILRRFSPIATFCVLGLGLSGIIQATLFISDFNVLFTTAYGQALLAKLALFGLLIGFGAWHQQVMMPKLRQKLAKLGNTLHHLRLTLLAESATSLLLLFFVALMKSVVNS